MVNTRTGGVPMNIAFSSYRSAALIERKMLQNRTLTIKLHQCILIEIKPWFLRCQMSLLVSQYIARIRNNTQTGTFQQSSFKIRCKSVLK